MVTDKFSLKSFSLLELMVVVSIICILTVVAVPSYRTYTISASIAALIPEAAKVQDEIEDAHNQGTIFGTSGNTTYVASTATDKPYALLDIIQVNYGCVDIGVDLAALNLNGSETLVIALCPYINEGSIEWQCGYDSSSYAAYIQYLPANCQQSNTSIEDTSF